MPPIGGTAAYAKCHNTIESSSFFDNVQLSLRRYSIRLTYCIDFQKNSFIGFAFYNLFAEVCEEYSKLL